MHKFNWFKSTLEARRAELEARVQKLERELDAPVTSDLPDQAVEREDDEVQELLGTAGLQELEMIRQALKRIEDDSYGICLTCGGDISLERLKAVPHTPICRDCAGARKL